LQRERAGVNVLYLKAERADAVRGDLERRAGRGVAGGGQVLRRDRGALSCDVAEGPIELGRLLRERGGRGAQCEGTGE
jgi:hypothetical protein